jgi:3',5'-cyclic AMP phosphodiesterase CpdA
LFAEAPKTDPNYFLLYSDIHLNADRKYIHNYLNMGATNMWDNFEQVCRESLALPRRPAAVLINGDIACRKGLPEDYATALSAMRPLRETGLTVHWALGNHDDRTNITKAAEADETLVGEMADRRVLLLQAPSANLFVLDSLHETDKTPGQLGEGQLAWLAAALDRHTDRPAIIFVHHQPFLIKPEMGDGTKLEDYVRSQKALEQPPVTPGSPAPPSPKPANLALLDTLPLLNVLLPRKHVKANFFGHPHEYTHKVIDGLHLVNLPSTAWIFIKGQPLGWMDMSLHSKGAKLRLYCLDPNHPLQHDQLELQWRA